MIWNLIKKNFLLLLPFILVFVASLYQPRDFDLGWHLKYGKYFFTHGQLLRDNIFSQEMPNYHWVNSSWGTDLITYSAFGIGGFLGLTIFGAVVVTLTFYVFSKAARLTLWYQALLFPLILYLEDPINLVSFRGQQLTFLFLGGLFLILSRYSFKKRHLLWWMVPLFFLWTNIHGEFLLGFAVCGLWFLLHLTKEIFLIKRGTHKTAVAEINFLIFVGLVSILATIVNPFGLGVYHEAFRHFGNKWQQYIVEWTPFVFGSTLWWNHIAAGILIGFGILSLVFEGVVIGKIESIGVVCILFILGLWMRRYAWPGYYLSLPIFSGFAEAFKPKDTPTTNKVAIILLICLLSFSIFLKWPLSQFKNMSLATYCERFISCSPKAITYLQTHPGYTKLLTLYGWGGWLIWNYPDIKPTIDGRMHLWADEKGYSAFAKYYPLEQNWADIDKTDYDAVFFNKEKPLYKRLIALSKEGKWELVYEDKSAVIFFRNKH